MLPDLDQNGAQVKRSTRRISLHKAGQVRGPPLELRTF
ncbi:hypothetical protein C4J90_1176 [Pseudomonas sp. R2-60-08W]|nr:hypothetical protein C4J90_1176 [Pseudomonas sp. R2-60-08W]